MDDKDQIIARLEEDIKDLINRDPFIENIVQNVLHLEQVLSRREHLILELDKENKALKAQIEQLTNRGLIARLLNK